MCRKHLRCHFCVFYRPNSLTVSMEIAAVARQMRPQRRRAVPVELLNAEAPMGFA